MLVQQLLPYYSLGHWLNQRRNGEVFAQTNRDLTICMEKFLPHILEEIPLPLAVTVPALHPKTDKICLQVIYGADFFEALYQFYQSRLSVSPSNFSWIGGFEEKFPKRLTWSTASDTVREKIFYTGIHVAELLPSQGDYFTCAQIEQLSKIDFGF